MRYALDRSLRISDGGRLLLGGSPGRLLRITDAGARLVERIGSGADVGGSRGADALVARLVDAGMVHPLPDPGTGASGPADVTLVVPVRDRADGVAQLLASVAPGPSLGGIVVVDDGSAEPLDLAGATVVRHGIAEGPAAARNAGAGTARTTILAFVDSDCTVAADWLDTLLAHFDDPRVVAVAPRVAAGHPPGPAADPSAGSERPVGVLASYDAHRSPLDLGEEPGEVVPGTRIAYVPSAALLVRSDAFAAVGGFDVAMHVGEDVDLVWRLIERGGRVRYEPRSVVHHEVRPTLRSWLRQRYDYGTSAAALDERHPGAVAPVAISARSAAVWGLVAAGHPLSGAVLGVSSAAALARRLPQVPRSEVCLVVAGGHVGAGRQLASGLVRAWWPVALAASLVSRRARRATATAAAVVVTDSWRQRRGADRSRPGPLGFAALRLADDLAYGAGVWTGCLRHRSLRALLPRAGAAASAGTASSAADRC